MRVLNFASGYKTYLTVAVGIALGVAQALGYMIPTWVDVITGFVGLGFHRMAVQNQSAQTTKDVQMLLQSILDQIEQPEAKTK